MTKPKGISWGALGFAGAQMGLGILGDYLGQQQAQRQAKEELKFQRRAEKRRVRLHNDEVDRHNAQAALIERILKRQSEQNKQFATDAANRAWLGGAVNRDRALTALAFDRSDRQAQLLQAVGAGNAAMEGDNRAGRRAFMMDTYGNFGRNESRDLLRIAEINTDERLNAADVRGQLAARHAAEDARIAIPRARRRHIQMAPMRSMPQGPSFFQQALGGLTHAFNAVGTYNDLAPTGKKLFG